MTVRLYGNVIYTTARRLGLDQRGISGIEFGVIGAMLSFILLNVVDIGVYVHTRMQVESAAQMGATAALSSCPPETLPATENCADLVSAVTVSLQSTPLGDRVLLQEGYPAEAYYCPTDGAGLTKVAEVSNKPADCTATGLPDVSPGDYVEVAVTVDYEPLFLDLTVAALLGDTITHSAMMRLQ